MLRTRLLFVVVACLLLASASWADDLGYIDCSQHPDSTQVLDKAGMTNGVVAVVPCGERFSILVRGEFYSQIKTKDGKVGYLLTYLITTVPSAAPKPQAAAAQSSSPATNVVSSKVSAANGFKIISPQPVAAPLSASTSSAPAEQPAPSAPVQSAPASSVSASASTESAPASQASQSAASAPAQSAASATAPAPAAQPQAPAPSNEAVSAPAAASASAGASSTPVEQPKSSEPQPAVALNAAAPTPATVQPNAAHPVQPEAASPASTPSASASSAPYAQTAPVPAATPASPSSSSASAAAQADSAPPPASAAPSVAQPGSTPSPQMEIPPSPPASTAPASSVSSSASAAAPSSAPAAQPEPAASPESQPVVVQPEFHEPQIHLKQRRAPRPFPEIGSVPMFEVFAGYGFTRFGSGANGTNLNGALGSFGFNFMSRLQIIGDASYNFVTVNGAKSVVYGDHFGPRFFLRSRSARGPIPFVEGLIGGTRIDTTTAGVTASDNGLSYKAGGGVDLTISRHLVVRLVDADYYRIPFLTNSQSNYSAAVGIVFRFGRSGRTE